MARVYISSTFKDLRREREAAAEAVRRREHFAAGMEVDRGDDRPPVESCLENVRSCGIYIGIFAWRYGFVPPGETRSITELEYEEAGRLGIRRLIFLLHDEAVWPLEWTEKDERIQGLRSRLERAHTVRRFSSAETLMIEMLTSLEREARGTAVPIPRLLPYLSDRSAQESELEEAVELWRGQEKPRPLVCIVHGDETQCHDQFLERLADLSLPRMLSRDARRSAITRHALNWPTDCSELSQFQRRLESGLARKILERPAGPEELNQALARNPGPVLIWTRVLSDECRPAGALQCFLDLWQRWPDLGPGQQLLVFLLVKYQVNRQAGWFRKWRDRRLNEDLGTSLQSLGLPRLDRVEGVLLSKLEDVPQLEVENWADQHASELCSKDRLFGEIRRLFDGWEAKSSSRRIPMELLAAELTKILRVCST